jgi:hypothetical protein
MNAVVRATSIMIDPFAEWARIERDSGDPAYLMSRYVAPLALIPALFGFLGACAIGVIVPGIGLVRAGLFDGIFGAIFGYLLAFVTVLLLGLIVHLLAPLFGGRRDFVSALKLAVYSYTPVWLVGIFLLLPGLRFLMLMGFYGAYLLVIGLPPLMKTPARKSAGFAAVVVLCACVLLALAAAAQRALFGTPGL